MKLSVIKAGRTIHISEDLNIPDGTEITIEISEPQVPITGSIDSDKTIAATAQQRSLVSFIGSANQILVFLGYSSLFYR